MAQQPTGREVKVKMSFVADTQQAKGEMAATRREVEKLGTEARKTQAEMSKVGKGGAGGAGGGGTPKANEPKEVSFAMALAKATATLMAFKQVIEGASRAVSAYYSGQWHNKTAGAVYEGMNAITFGAVDWQRQKIDQFRYAESRGKYMRETIQEPRFNMRLGLQAGLNQQSNSLYEQQGSAEDAYRAQMMSASPGMVSGMLGGMGLRDERDARIIQAERGVRESRGGIIIGEGAKSRADSEVDRIRGLVGKARNAATSAQFVSEEMMGVNARNPYAIESQRYEIRKRDAELLMRQKELETAIQNQQKAGLDLEQRRHQLRQANLNVSKAELDIVKEQEAKAKSQATDFGMMSGADKLALKYALQQAQTQGIDTLPEETRRLLASSGLTSEFAQKESERLAADDPVYQAIVQALGGKTTTQLTKEKITLENKIELDTQIDAEDLAKGMKVQWDKFFQQMEPMIQEIANQQLKLALNQRKQLEQ